jgi:hypothetical protein
MGIIQIQKEGNKQIAKPSEKEFKAHLVYFLHFYKLLVVVLKICIAKHDEKLLSEKMQND